MPLDTGNTATSKRFKIRKTEKLSVPCCGGREGRGREKRKVCLDSPSKLNHHIRMLRVSWGGGGQGAERGLEGSTPGIHFSWKKNKQKTKNTRKGAGVLSCKQYLLSGYDSVLLLLMSTIFWSLKYIQYCYNFLVFKIDTVLIISTWNDCCMG